MEIGGFSLLFHWVFFVFHKISVFAPLLLQWDGHHAGRQHDAQQLRLRPGLTDHGLSDRDDALSQRRPPLLHQRRGPGRGLLRTTTRYHGAAAATVSATVSTVSTHKEASLTRCFCVWSLRGVCCDRPVRPVCPGVNHHFVRPTGQQPLHQQHH